ncbi:Equilibrative nucleoside transporter 1 [Lamellibrachia satsuma]|nr:Equilibrative nucleoside transporter 1 [Lamellibrachia satsuma]
MNETGVETERESLLQDVDNVNGSDSYEDIPTPPRDRGHFVYMIFYLLGIGSLLPWNFFSNGQEYFKYKLRNVSLTNESNYDVLKYEREWQIKFENYLTMAAMIPNVLFLFLNTASSRVISVKIRTLVSAIVMAVLFGLTLSLTKINTDSWQTVFFIITMATIIVMNAASAVFQGAVIGLSSVFPKQYPQSVMAGMGMGGTIAASCSVLTTAFSHGPVESAFSYFLSAMIVLIIAILGYLLLPTTKYAAFHFNHMSRRMSKVLNVAKNNSDEEVCVETKPHEIPLLAVFKMIWGQALTVFFTFFVTLSCYPSINGSIESVNMDTSKHLPWENTYFKIVGFFLFFNVGDLIGRSTAGLVQWPREDSWWLTIICVVRVLFIPVFILCNVQPRHASLPVLINNDYVPLVASCLFGFSNGHLGTLIMMYGPRRVTVENKEMAGSMLTFFLALGLAVGSLFSLLIKDFIQP